MPRSWPMSGKCLKVKTGMYAFQWSVLMHAHYEGFEIYIEAGSFILDYFYRVVTYMYGYL